MTITVNITTHHNFDHEYDEDHDCSSFVLSGVTVDCSTQLNPNTRLWLLLFHHHHPDADAEADDNAEDAVDFDDADDGDAVDYKASPRAGIDWTSVPILRRHHTKGVQQ